MTLDSTRPCVMFDSHHPKDYLALRRLSERCEAEGIRAIWTVHDKDVLVDLLREHGFDPRVLAKAQVGLLRKLVELAVYDWRLARIARQERPLAMVGKTVTSAQVGRLLGIPSLLINDDSAAANPQYRYLACPFATRIVSADCLGEHYGERQRSYSGLMELAYLHPDAFTPDPAVRQELGVAEGERIFLIRQAAFDAYHDVAQRGLSAALLQAIIERLEWRGRVFIVAEQALTGPMARYRLPTRASRLHDVIATSDIVLGDGLTVCVEAALLGVPAIAVGSYIGKHSYSEEIEKRFGLMFGFRPDRQDDILTCLDRLLAQSDLRQDWAARRQAMLAVWSDPTEVYWEELQALFGSRREAGLDRAAGTSRMPRTPVRS